MIYRKKTNLQCIFEFITGLVNLTAVSEHTAEPEVTIDVVGALHQDVLVKAFSLIVLTQSLVHAGQVVPDEQFKRF